MTHSYRPRPEFTPRAQDYRDLLDGIEAFRTAQYAAWGSRYRGMGMREALGIFEAAGLLQAYDTALPYEFAEYLAAAGRDTAGLVWCYDNASIFGYPYPVTNAALETLRAL